jgi:hypothetical protein
VSSSDGKANLAEPLSSSEPGVKQRVPVSAVLLPSVAASGDLSLK